LPERGESSVQKWIIEGFRGGNPTGLSRQLTGGENQVRVLLQRLAARHLTDEEVIDATFGTRHDLEISNNSGSKLYSLMTNGPDCHYIATIDDSYAHRS
jgi:hypothetical protein